ncbi:MAG: NUDIX pyrophosphatase [candidate division Zixibacteria bacterium]|nr:NUDIX pyrophosphatase [candidate division Zixibacteria bacterium]
MRQPIQVAIYCVRMNGADREYLLLRRIPSGGGYWQAVSGGVEGDESCPAAARRELEEETGFAPACFEQMTYSYSFPVGPEMRYLYEEPVDLITEIVFLARVESGREPKLDLREHDAWQWCTYETALEMLYWPGNRESLKHCERYLRSDGETAPAKE